MHLDNQRVMMSASKRPISTWLGWLTLVFVFTTACVFLSKWQFDRQAEVVETNSRIAASYAAEPRALEEILAIDQTWNPALEFRSVLVSGQYIPDQSYLVRNRPYNAYPGFLQLVAFQTDGGSVIWVERGWLPTGRKSDSPDEVPAVDSTHRQLTLRLRPSEPALDRTAPPGQLSSINLESASSELVETDIYTQAYGRLISEYPELPTGQKIGKPELSEGNHLSYAMQWILFGLMAIGAVLWTISQERRRKQGLPPRRLKMLNRDKDAEVEDKILE
jgi:cytochrome oxidase assembly protein ShyY1